MVKKTVAVLLGVVGLCLAGAVFYVTRSISLTGTPGRAPASQPPVATIPAGDLDQLRSRFNDAADIPRLIVMLSPT